MMRPSTTATYWLGVDRFGPRLYETKPEPTYSSPDILTTPDGRALHADPRIFGEFPPGTVTPVYVTVQIPEPAP